MHALGSSDPRNDIYSRSQRIKENKEKNNVLSHHSYHVLLSLCYSNRERLRVSRHKLRPLSPATPVENGGGEAPVV
jgi:hypothetical protein